MWCIFNSKCFELFISVRFSNKYTIYMPQYFYFDEMWNETSKCFERYLKSAHVHVRTLPVKGIIVVKERVIISDGVVWTRTLLKGPQECLHLGIRDDFLWFMVSKQNQAKEKSYQDFIRSDQQTRLYSPKGIMTHIYILVPCKNTSVFCPNTPPNHISMLQCTSHVKTR